MFKTIFSRAGNVKAGKFVASQEDMNSADYSEDEFENLNDIETVLDAVNIKLRENYSTWRSIDDVLEDVGKNWNTWDKTTQNAVATALAGTRQRENVLTLFANWDDVSKYAEIAENAYGTATKKMEAYSDSIDAAKNRLSAALEKIVLDLNNFKVIKDFYDVMTFLVSNLKSIIPVLLGYVTITRADSVAGMTGGLVERLVSRAMNVGMSSMATKGNQQAATGIIQNWKKNAYENLSQGYLMAQEQAYAQSLSRYTAGLEERQAQNIRALQAELLSIEATNQETAVKDKRIIAEQWLEGVYNETAASEMTWSTRRQLASMLYTQASNQEVADILRQVALGGNLTEEQSREIDARGGITRLLYEEMQLATQNNKVRKQMSNNLLGSISNDTKDKVAAGVGAGVGNLLGMTAGSMIGNNVANAYGLSGTGQVLAMTGGSLIGGFGLKALGGGLGGLLGGGNFGASALAAVGMTNPAGWIAIGTAIASLVVGAVVSFVKAEGKKKIEEAQNELLELSERYDTSKNMLVTASKYSELAKGVDNFGNNVSLSNEDYEKFLDYSNQLVEVFPELLTYIDDEGNAIAYMGNAAESTTDKVKDLINALQMETDIKAINPDLWQSKIDEAFKEQKQLYKEINESENKINRLNNYTDINAEYLEDSLWSESSKQYLIEGYASGELAEYIKQYDEAFKRKYIVDNGISGINSLENVGITQNDIDNAIEYFGVESYQDLVKTTNAHLREKATSEFENASSDLEMYMATGNWEYLSDLDEVNLEEINKQINSEQIALKTAERQLRAYNNSLASTNISYARANGYYEGLSSNESTILSTALSNIDTFTVTDSGQIKEKTNEEMQDDIEAIASKMLELFQNQNLIELITNASTESGTIQEIRVARKALLKSLKEVFGEDGVIDEEEAKVLISFGFEYDEESGNITDVKDRFTQLKEALNTDDGSFYYAWGVGDMTVEDYNVLHHLAKNETIKAGEWIGEDDYSGTSREIVRNLIDSDRYGEGDLTHAVYYQANLISAGEGLKKRLEEYYEDIKTDADNTANSVAEKFSDLPEHMRNAIYAGGQDVLEVKTDSNSIKDDIKDAIDDATDDVFVTYRIALDNASLTVAKEQAKAVFSNIEDINKDGILGEWSEIKEMLDQVTDSYKLLKEAREEEREAGHLSWETALQLLSANEAYLDVLEFENGQLSLNTNAEQTMAKIQLQAMKSQIDAKIDLMEAEASELENKIKEAEGTHVYTETVGDEVDATYDAIDAQNSFAESNVNVANTAIQAAYALREQAKQAKTLALIESGNLNTEISEVDERNLNNKPVQYEAVEAVRKQVQVFVTEADLAKMREDLANRRASIDKLKGLSSEIGEFIENGDFSVNSYRKSFLSPSTLADKSTKDALTDLEKVKKVLGAINKEYEKMVASSIDYSNSLEGLSKKVEDSYYQNLKENYYDVKRALINRGIASVESLLGNMTLGDIFNIQDDDKFNKYLGYWTDYTDLQVQLANLDDEQVQDKITIMEYEQATAEALLEQYKLLLAASDDEEERAERAQKVYEYTKKTYEEKVADLQNQEAAVGLIIAQYKEEYKILKTDAERYEMNKKINDALKEQYEQYKAMNDLMVQLDEWELEYLNPYVNSKQYNSVIEDAKSQYESIMSSSYDMYMETWNRVYESNIELGASISDAQAAAYQAAEPFLSDYITAYKAYGDLVYKVIDDKLTDIEWHIDKLNKEKPDEWDNYDLISKYASQEIALNQRKLNELKEALKDTSMLTDEQIKNLVDQYNDAYKEIHNIKVKELQDQISYQERIYQAATNEVNRYIKDLEKQKEAVEETYDKELEKLQDKADTIERTNRLIELQNNLMNANKEKERVYRQGIGWVYESNRNKVRQAQKDLDDFSLQDNIDDLQTAKDKELELLDEAIQGWNNYLEMLAYQYEEYDRLQEQKLLRDYFGVSTNEEVQKIITDDMVKFNKDYTNNINNFITDLDSLFGKFVSVFEKLLEKLTGLRFDLWDEQTKEFNLLDYHDYIKGNEVDDIANKFRNPNKTNLVKKKTYDSIYEIVKSDAKLAAQEYQETGTQSKYMTNSGYLDYSSMIYDDIKNGNWLSAYEHAALRESKIDNQGLDLKSLGWRDTKTVFLDAMKANGASDIALKNFSDNFENFALSYANAELINRANQDEGIGVLSELNQVSIGIASMLPQELGYDFAQLITTSIANASNLSGDVISSSDTLSAHFSDNFSEVISQDATYYDQVVDLLKANNQATKENMAAINAAYTAAGGNLSDSKYGSSGYSGSDSSSSSGKADQSVINQAKADWWQAQSDYNAGKITESQKTDIQTKAHNTAESERAKEGYSGGNDGSQHIALGSHALGIETGPVTYTGLGMLHGTPSSPEYVLNSDQAYNVLRYIATSRPQDNIETNNSSNTSTVQYVVEGDIVLEGVNDPASFWDDVTTAMGTRWNVTKNNRVR